MDDIKCFYLEETERVARSLRRYSSAGSCPLNPGDYSYHNAETLIEPLVVATKEIPAEDPNIQDPRWPEKCGCGYTFQPSDNLQVSLERIFRRTDTGHEYTLRAAPPGAMWFAWWLERVKTWCGPDGRALIVRLPDGRDWHIDSRASNCTMPEDTEHRCWVRHGEVPKITVDKDGNTCKAGKGSIKTASWHGFLIDGVLTETRKKTKKKKK